MTSTTHGVTDPAQSREFYAAWGWVPEEANGGPVFLKGSGLIIDLLGPSELPKNQASPGHVWGLAMNPFWSVNEWGSTDLRDAVA